MAIVATSYGSAQNKTAATTVAFTTTADIPTSTLLVLAVCADNTSASAPAISSITAVGGGTWTNRAGATSMSGATATAGAGVFVYCQTLYTSSPVSSGTSITVTFNSSPTAKAVGLWGFSDATATLRGTVVSGASTGGTPSAATGGTAPVADDVVIGIAGAENNAAMTGDTDTLNGSWSAISSVNTTGGNAQTNTSINMQYKVVTASGAQTFNPTGGAADSVAIVFAMQPMPALSLSDGLDITDIEDSVEDYERSLSDDVSIPESDVVDVAKALGDLVGADDSLDIQKTINRDYPDLVSALDALAYTIEKGGYPKAWVISTWRNKPCKMWTGSDWRVVPWRVWTGSSWEYVK